MHEYQYIRYPLVRRSDCTYIIYHAPDVDIDQFYPNPIPFDLLFKLLVVIIPPLSQDLHEVVGEVTTSKVQTKNSVRKSVTLISISLKFVASMNP